MNKSTGRSKFSLSYVFASFFGAAMIASAFAYYNYKFSEYKFFDFQQHTFYTKKEIFSANNSTYTVIVYSSNMEKIKDIVTKVKKSNPILAIDLYQKRFKEEDSIISISSGMNTLLKFIQRFNIYNVPCVFEIKRVKKQLYKQSSMIEEIE
jgi:predicted MPP superfamily phosphohydrolase